MNTDWGLCRKINLICWVTQPMIENNIYYCEISEAPRDYRLRHSSIHIHLSVNVHFYIIRCINKCTLYNIYIYI